MPFYCLCDHAHSIHTTACVLFRHVIDVHVVANSVMGNCVRSNIENSPSAIRPQYQYQPTEHVDTAPADNQPDEPSQQQLDEQDQALPWQQQQEVLVQHIADREGVCTICVSTYSSMHII